MSEVCEPSNTKYADMKCCDAKYTLNKMKLHKYKNTGQDR